MEIRNNTPTQIGSLAIAIISAMYFAYVILIVSLVGVAFPIIPEMPPQAVYLSGTVIFSGAAIAWALKGSTLFWDIVTKGDTADHLLGGAALLFAGGILYTFYSATLFVWTALPDAPTTKATFIAILSVLVFDLEDAREALEGSLSYRESARE